MVGGGSGRGRVSLWFLGASAFLGPSMIIALKMSEKNFSEYYGMGGEYGLSLMAVALVSLVFKFALVDGLARYTLFKNESVFARLTCLPGPKNWAVWAVTTVFVLELSVYSRKVVGATTDLGGMTDLLTSPEVFALIAVLLIAGFLLLRSRRAMEIVIYAVISFTLFVLICGVASSISVSSIEPPKSMPLDVLFAAGSGSGLSLLLYSVWLSDKAKNVKTAADYKNQLRDVRRSLGLSFFIVGVVTFLTLLIVDPVISDGLPSASLLLPIGAVVMMFGVVMAGMDGRARAVSKMLRQARAMNRDKGKTYQALITVFMLIIVTSIIIEAPGTVMRVVSAVSAAMFAMAGFVIIYVDMRLPEHARGGTLWTVVALIGSSFFLITALLEESFLLNFGLPLALRMMAVGAVLYAMQRFGALFWLLKNARKMKGMAAMILIFSAFSVFGTAAGIEFAGLVINFRDLGAMMAGLLGGPLVGMFVGLIGGAYRYSMGGWTATACFAATVSAGLVSGLLSRYWKGRIDYRKAVFTGVLAESMHLLLFLPLLQQGGSTEVVLETIRELFLPMTVVNALGLFLLVYIMDKEKRMRNSNSSKEDRCAPNPDEER